MKNNQFFRENLLINKHLAPLTWFNVGGNCEYFFQPKNDEILIQFLKEKKMNCEISPLGAGSNILIRDKGYEGIIIHFVKINKIQIDKDGIITAEAGAMDAQVSRFARDNNRSGLEFLIGIPGSIGGGIRMNSGAYGSDFNKILIDVKAVNKNGEVRVFKKDELGLGYRTNKLNNDWLFINARFNSFPGEKVKIQKLMKEIIFKRKETQPTGVKTGGSTFKNGTRYKAWEVIDKSGCRGLEYGGAEISKKHCNFIINKKNATASDIEKLGEKVKEKVFIKTGYRLNWEIKIMGKK